MTREFPKNNPPKIERPTVGRIVHVFGMNDYDIPKDVPRAAIVAGLADEELVIYAAVFTSGGGHMSGLNPIKHASLPRHEGDLYWDWMVYQKGQARKAEELEAKLKSVSDG